MHVGSPLSAVVGWFKTMSTNEYIRGVKQLGWPPFDRKLWQRNYYERIIRDDASLRNVAFYIDNNPAHWRNDDFYHRH
jgi:REP element-mobilizing transposase RayT